MPLGVWKEKWYNSWILRVDQNGAQEARFALGSHNTIIRKPTLNLANFVFSGLENTFLTSFIQITPRSWHITRKTASAKTISILPPGNTWFLLSIVLEKLPASHIGKSGLTPIWQIWFLSSGAGATDPLGEMCQPHCLRASSRLSAKLLPFPFLLISYGKRRTLLHWL